MVLQDIWHYTNTTVTRSRLKWKSCFFTCLHPTHWPGTLSTINWNQSFLHMVIFGVYGSSRNKQANTSLVWNDTLLQHLQWLRPISSVGFWWMQSEDLDWKEKSKNKSPIPVVITFCFTHVSFYCYLENPSNVSFSITFFL